MSLKELFSTREVGVASLKESFLRVVQLFISLELFSAKELDLVSLEELFLAEQDEVVFLSSSREFFVSVVSLTSWKCCHRLSRSLDNTNRQEG